MWILVAAIGGLIVGCFISHDLSRLSYRRTGPTTTRRGQTPSPTTDEPNAGIPDLVGSVPTSTTVRLNPTAATTPQNLPAIDLAINPDDTAATGPCRTTTAAPSQTADSESEPAQVDETQLPRPTRWWIPVAVAAAWALVVWRVPLAASAGLDDWARLAGWLAFASVGAWLAAVDLDVQRLPDRVQVLLAGLVIIAGILHIWGNPTAGLTGVLAAIGCGAGFFLIHLVSRGGLGLGDVKLAMTCAWWLALDSTTAVIAAMMLACVMAIAYSLVTRERQFAFGPWLITGALIGGLLW
ncbi:MAG: prepilin peptidase [Propionibacteriaceae bacterium]|jgi:leader peptidase (prepilin peptidase)/N-methyltransferase|nr:prepilin peptidase [Propionibacteriaceae bacterium]